ncbi:transglycosylase domain-containing protein [Paenibacillus sp. NPDC058071]|uniref:transglycosylase domain-containing protein n=1 Tax=Paenibacillus sp. NPDC058071 TaxID=3346326 RepID=UPI0036D8AA78
MKKTKFRPGKPGQKYAFPKINERFLPYLLKMKKRMRRATIIAASFVLLIAGGLLYLRMQSLPVATISQTSQMLDLQGQIIDTFHAGENRHSVPLDHISPYVVQATLAIEDRRFFDHHGFDVKGLARAVVVNVESLSAKQGASTLTQQLARNLYLSHEKTWQRKMKEAVYTVQLEMNYSKKEILGLYLNQIYYGHGAYGIEAASRLYYNKKASELTLAESAMLAGIPKGPKYYSPFMNMKNAKDRQHVILNEMVRAGDITQAEADAAYKDVLKLQPLGTGDQSGFAPYFRDYVRYIAVDKLGINEQLLNEGGITIYTTLDPTAQRAAEEAIEKGLAGGEDQEAALISIDPRNGYIKAMVGGRDYGKNQLNRTLVETRQPGSSFKPILYLTALQQKLMTPVSRFKSEPTSFTYDEGRKTYEPRNYNDKYFNDYIDMRTAMASSDNIYAVSTFMTVGSDKVIETARKLGITSPLNPVPSLALGTSPISPLQMASAFGTFASGGIRHEPVAILRITDRNGHLLYEAKDQAIQAIDPANAYVMTSLMESVFQGGGTASRIAALIHRPVAGKSGTTATDAWLVGFTPELATAVWTGYDKGRKLTVAEAHRAAPIFANYTEQALAAVPPKMFTIPPGVSEVYIDPSSGKLAADTCPSKRLEAFVIGTEPTEICGKPTTAGEERQEGSQEERRTWWKDFKRWWHN